LTQVHNRLLPICRDDYDQESEFTAAQEESRRWFLHVSYELTQRFGAPETGSFAGDHSFYQWKVPKKTNPRVSGVSVALVLPSCGQEPKAGDRDGDIFTAILQ
jgi:hypothetical protein